MSKETKTPDTQAAPAQDRRAAPFTDNVTDITDSLPMRRKSDRGFLGRLKFLFRNRHDTNLREAIEEYIDSPESYSSDSVDSQEKALISNVLKLRDVTVVDVMVPRADIVAIDVETTQADLLLLLSEKQVSRLPVYKENLDQVIGYVHIKDILAGLASGQTIAPRELLKDLPVVSPTMPVLDLLLQMRESLKHMVLVVDEYGGIDGLVTIGDLIETIVGEIEDEYDMEEAAEMSEDGDGSILADGRVDIEEFEERFGNILSEEEREESDTLGGLVFHIAGRIPARGEVLKHNTGMVFEVLEADPRRISRLRIRNIPTHTG